MSAVTTKTRVKVCSNCRAPWRTDRGIGAPLVTGDWLDELDGRGQPDCSCSWNGMALWESVPLVNVNVVEVQP